MGWRVLWRLRKHRCPPRYWCSGDRIRHQKTATIHSRTGLAPSFFITINCVGTTGTAHSRLEPVTLRMQNTILVTGGAGFIGSNFILQRMQDESASVVNLDKLTYAGNLQNLE